VEKKSFLEMNFPKPKMTGTSGKCLLLLGKHFLICQKSLSEGVV
jgi:hypothetical protein